VRDADVIVVGGGHNGLTCAAYLARAGQRVIVVEARQQVGGCASTVDAIGARVNICNCDHTSVLGSGIVEELELAGHGLRYLDVDPVSIAIGWADEPVFVQWRDVDRTVDGLARHSAGVAAAYRRYVGAVTPVAALILAASRAAPTTRGLLSAAASVAARNPAAAARLLAWSRRSLVDVLSSFGLPPWLQAAMATTGPAVWGLPPNAPGTGVAAIGPVLRHLVGVGRPAGGSGALPAALADAMTAHGGQVLTGRRVAAVLAAGGAAVGIRLDDGTELRADTVVAAVDPRKLFVAWCSGEPALARLRDQWLRRGRPDGYESKVDAVVAALPVPRSWDRISEEVLPPAARHVPTTVVSPTLAEQIAAASVKAAGRVSDRPMFLVNTPSVLDETMSPPAGHLLSLEVLWTPYNLTGGWAGTREPERWLEGLASLVQPGFLDGVRRWRAMTPEDYERDFGLDRGYAPSFPGGPVAALRGRPRELARYATPLRGLYLTGAGTFPGAGVWGASGRNTAHVILAAGAPD
jgi:phytoene dehydrogenase-like protein